MASEDLLTTGQVAEVAGVHRTTVHHWERDKKLVAAQTVNGIRLFRRSDVEQYIASRDVEAAS